MPAPATAQTSSIPEKIRGLWAFPDCAQAEIALIYTERFVLESSLYNNTLSRIDHTEPRGDAYIMTQADKRFMLQPTNDGVLMQYNGPISSDDFDPFADGDNPKLIKYSHCLELFRSWPGLNEDGLRGFMMLDAIDAACESDKDSSCHKTLLRYADQDQDNKLSYRELALSYRTILFLSASIGENFSTKFPGDSSQNAPAFAAALIQGADRNGDAQLNIEEIKSSWYWLKFEKEMTGFRAQMKALSKLLPFLKKTD